MKRELSFAWRALVVGAGYAGTLALINVMLGRSADAHSLIWWFVGGTAIGLALGPLAWSMAATWRRHMLLWGSIVFFNIASVTIEGRFFVPGYVPGSLAMLLLQQLAAGLVATWLIVRLFAPTELLHGHGRGPAARQARAGQCATDDQQAQRARPKLGPESRRMNPAIDRVSLHPAGCLLDPANFRHHLKE